MKFSLHSCVIVLFVSLVGFVSCKKLDDEPDDSGRQTLISRLYVSFQDYQDGGESSIKNLMIVDPADTTSLTNIYQYLSPSKGGGPVTFDPRVKAIFQASANDAVLQDTFLRVIPFQNDIYGIPGTSGNIGFTGFRNVRGLAYYLFSQSTGTGSAPANSDFLLAATNNGTNSSLYAISRPTGKTGSRGGAKIIDKQINLGAIRPTSMVLLRGNGSNEPYLLVGFNNDGSNKGAGFAVYTNLKQELIDRPRDTIVNAEKFAPALKVYIAGNKANLGSIAYAPQRKLLAVTTFSGSGGSAVGEVLFFNDPDNVFKPGGASEKEVTPYKIISGGQTGLVQPQSVGIDDRVEEGKYFYVSDRSTKKISRFLLTDQGDAKPDLTQIYNNLTPSYIFLDARSATNFGN